MLEIVGPLSPEPEPVDEDEAPASLRTPQAAGGEARISEKAGHGCSGAMVQCQPEADGAADHLDRIGDRDEDDRVAVRVASEGHPADLHLRRVLQLDRTRWRRGS